MKNCRWWWINICVTRFNWRNGHRAIEQSWKRKNVLCIANKTLEPIIYNLIVWEKKGVSVIIYVTVDQQIFSKNHCETGRFLYSWWLVVVHQGCRVFRKQWGFPIFFHSFSPRWLCFKENSWWIVQCRSKENTYNNTFTWINDTLKWIWQTGNSIKHFQTRQVKTVTFVCVAILSTLNFLFSFVLFFI